MQKVIKAGNSLAVTIPSQFVKMVGIRVGDGVKVTTIPDTGIVKYHFSGVHQLKLLGKLSTH